MGQLQPVAPVTPCWFKRDPDGLKRFPTPLPFFRHASEPASDDTIDGPVDFARVQASAKEHGGVEILGPPPFANAKMSPRG